MPVIRHLLPAGWAGSDRRQGRGPLQHKHVHGALKQGLDQTQAQNLAIWRPTGKKPLWGHGRPNVQVKFLHTYEGKHPIE